MRDASSPAPARPAPEAAGAIVGVVLAGGLATRLGGGDTGLLPLAGRPILAHVVERLGPQVDRLILTANGDPARFAAFGLPVVADSVAGHPGPLAGILAGMERAAAEGATAIVTAAGDTPFLPRDLAARLAAAGSPVAIAVTPSAAGRRHHPVFGLWPVGLRDDLRAALLAGTRRVADWARRHGAVEVTFPDEAAFFNVNRPGDLDRARALARDLDQDPARRPA